jgi:hypothetical protein
VLHREIRRYTTGPAGERAASASTVVGKGRISAEIRRNSSPRGHKSARKRPLRSDKAHYVNLEKLRDRGPRDGEKEKAHSHDTMRVSFEAMTFFRASDCETYLSAGPIA